MATKTLNTPPTKSAEERWARLRSHKRIISRVRLQVEWDENGEKQRANAVTVDVSHSGCMAIVGAPLPLHKNVRLIHPETGRQAAAEVVWRDHEAWDVGLELEKPDASFWGVKF
jgi:PilZ domain